MKSFYWYCFVLWLSFKWCFRINLGDCVWYERGKYIVVNGVRSDSWRLSGLQNCDAGWVSRSSCRKVLSPRNIVGSFSSGYHFYMGYWYQIWKSEGIKPWMRKCEIW